MRTWFEGRFAFKSISPAPQDIPKTRDGFKKWFYSQGDHQWILENYSFLKTFEQTFNALQVSDFKKISSFGGIRFVALMDKMACCLNPVDTVNCPVIFLFPDLVKLMMSPLSDQAVGVLLHEIGHLVLGHEGAPGSYMKAQYEADEFAKIRGYGEELYCALKSDEAIEEVSLRLEKLLK
jgi:hypothetical protein